MDYKILIVDDEPDIVSMLASFFSGKGYQALTAHSGAEALRKIGQTPDIILLDINMPDMDGLEVCEMIRDRVSCPILFLTARIEDADKVKGFSAGGDDYILKPFSLMELEERVCVHLRREARYAADVSSKAALTYYRDSNLREIDVFVEENGVIRSLEIKKSGNHDRREIKK